MGWLSGWIKCTKGILDSVGAEDILSIYYNGMDYHYQLSKGWA